MLRVFLIAVAVVVGWLLLVKLSREMKSASVDWKGWTVFAGFIVLAFYLNHVTGIG
jgi:hypothetical protein